jgi:SSS family solute:Na+ symporter
MFWPRATTAGAFVGAVGSVGLSYLYWKYWPEVPFMNRIGYVFLLCLGAAMLVSLLQPKRAKTSTIELSDIDYSTSTSFNIAGVVVIAVLVALYYIFW